jgi:CHAT domain-containing protein/tetratricopeptide (TPR) repeat protein
MLRAFGLAWCCVAAAASPPSLLLRPGVSSGGNLSAGETRSYRIDVGGGRFVRVAADQRHLDLVLTLRDSAGVVLVTSDTFDQGEESLSAIAEESQSWTLDVSASSAAATRGGYRIVLAEYRPAVPADQQRIEAEALSTRVRSLRRRGTRESLKDALTSAGRAAALWQSLGAARSCLRARIEIGDIHFALNEYGEARKHYEMALVLSRAEKDYRSEAEILNNFAMSHLQQGRSQEALDFLQRSREVWTRTDVSNGRGATLNNLGLLAWQTGQARDALTYYDEALRVLRATEHSRGEAFVRNNLALAYVSLGEYGRALRGFRQAIPMFLTAGDRLAAGRAWRARAKVHLLLGDLPNAAQSIDEALPLIKPSGDQRAYAEALNILCEVRLAAGDPGAALDAGIEALDLFRRFGDRRGVGLALQNLASVRVALGKPDEAVRALEEAIQAFQAVGAKENQAAALHMLAMARRGAGEFEAAREALEPAMAIVESLRVEAPGERLRASFLATRLDYYHAYIDLLLQNKQSRSDPALRAAAFEASERARARGMVDLLRQRRWEIFPHAAPDLAAQGRRVQQQLSYLLERTGRLPESEQAASKQEIDGLVERLQLIDDRLRAADPRSALLFAPPKPELSAVQRALEDGSLLLEFSLGEPRSYVFAVTADGLEVHELPGRRDIERLARTISEVLHRGQNPRTLLARLGRMLLEPVSGQLQERRLLLAVDGALHYIPFAALPEPATGEALVERHEIVYVPSATVLLALGAELAGRTPAPRTLAIVADPIYDALDSRVPANGGAAARPGDYGRLVFSRRGAQAISALLPESERLLLMDFQANKQRFLKTPLDQYRMLHFAMHSSIDERHPELSGLVFGLVSLDGSPRDGFLRLIDIYNLRLRADFVVLSACRSSLGREVRGEGLIALTRGFLYAGAAGVIASLWPVDDEASSELMRRFYEGILRPKPLSPAAALRQAQLAMRRERRWSEPYYWAAHAFQGLEVKVQ